MSQCPSDLKYAATHEWSRLEADGTVTVGITDHAQSALGDVVYIELPEMGRSLRQGEVTGVVESVKAASDLYAPISGHVIALNADLEDSPEAINDDPYGAGWFYRVQPDDPRELEGLLSAADYQAQCEEG